MRRSRWRRRKHEEERGGKWREISEGERDRGTEGGERGMNSTDGEAEWRGLRKMARQHQTGKEER